MWQIIKGFLYHNIEPLYQVFLLKDLIYRRMKMRWVIQTKYWHLHKDIINKSSIKNIITFILSHHPQKPPHPRCYEPDHNIRYPFILECRECDWCGTMSVCTLKRSNAQTQVLQPHIGPYEWHWVSEQDMPRIRKPQATFTFI